MPNYKLVIEYDGTRFYGWQVQPAVRTVQGELQAALAQFLREPVQLSVAGRTDRGVHALAQVANFRATHSWAPERIRHAINGLTGNDVVIRDVTIVDNEFHARFDAKARQYKYVLTKRPLAIGRQYAAYIRHPLNLDLIRTATALLLGEHQFAAFSQKMPDEKHYLCNVELAEWMDEDDRLRFRIRANRFLHGMVRLLVGTLLQVGRDKLAVSEFERMLRSEKHGHPVVKAPAHGLFLEHIIYEKGGTL